MELIVYSDEYALYFHYMIHTKWQRALLGFCLVGGILLALGVWRGFAMKQKSSVDTFSPATTTTAATTTDIVQSEGLPTEEGLVRPMEGGEGKWQTYSSKKGGISFSYPASFFLLDRTDSQLSCVYMSPREIFFSDFAGGYIEPLELCFVEDASQGGWMNDLSKARTRAAIINGKNAVITSVEGEVGAYGEAFSLLSILFPDQRIRITGTDRLGVEVYSTIKEAVERIADTLVIQ